jgi:transcriptional regulator with XRE-family HTH domain
MNFGKALKRYLKEKQLTPYQLGKSSGVPTTRIYDLLNGKRKYPGFKNFLKLAESLNLPPWKFLKILMNK